MTSPDSPGTPTPAGARHRSGPDLDPAYWQRRLEELITLHQVPGAALGVLRAGRITPVGVGVLNEAAGVEVTPDSLFQIGSITKAWTATLIMQLADEGLLRLDTPVAELLPDFQVADPQVTRVLTIRQLLNHTSGMDGDVFIDTGRGDECLAAYVARMAEVNQNHPIGATWSYCNAGYILLGRIVEYLTGSTWDAALTERLIEPLGLRATVTLPEQALLHRAAVGHFCAPGADPEPASQWMLPRCLGPAGLITSSVHDLLAFVRMHLSHGTAPDGSRVLSADATAAMAAEEVLLPHPYGIGDSWGLGWIRHGWDGHRLIGHDGTTLGQTAYLRVLSEADLAVALLTNGNRTQDLFQDVFREIFADLAGVTMPAGIAPPAEPVPVDPGAYLGVYERTSVRTEVFERDGKLILRSVTSGAAAAFAPTMEHVLVPVRQDLFALRVPETQTWSPVYFHTLDDGSRYVSYGARANPRVEPALPASTHGHQQAGFHEELATVE
ncbi:serine hydrolase domain-containing protein [Streptomyces sp. KR80]|uniref:serine hydrolase domain-containing protein n=1 Tax=Streptomyces sp. KR80 TaxID=3457426 RepID=UPI003FD4AE9A